MTARKEADAKAVKKKTILFIFSSEIDWAKGTSLRAKNILMNLDRENHRIVALTRWWGKEHCLPEGIEVHRLARSSSFVNVFRYRRLMRETAPDLIYSQTLYSGFLGTFLAFAYRKKHIIDVHSLIEHEDFKFSRFSPKLAFLRMTQRLVFRLADGLTVVCHPLQEKLKKVNKRISVLHGGVDVATFTTQKKDTEVQDVIDAHPGRIPVIYAGNFREYQGVNVLFEAIRRMGRKADAFVFICVGNKKSIDHPSTLQEAERIRNLVFIEARQSEDMPAILNCAEILLIPRTSHPINTYAFPSKLPEYMATGKAIIGTDVGDIGMLIKDGKTGLLIPPDSPEALIAALQRLKNAPLRKRLGEGARKFVAEHYRWKDLCDETIRFMDSVIDGKKKRK